MADFKLQGLGVALVTPFTSEKEIDYPALGKLIDHVVGNGADFLVVLGTTGETPALFEDEKRAIRRFVVERAKNRIPLVLGLGGNSTMGVVKELRSVDLSGFSAILSVVPFYNKPSQEGIKQHYLEIARNSPLPVILYNVPGRTGVNMEAATTIAIAAEAPNVIGIKEASGNFNQIEEIIKNKRPDFQVISGDDAITFPLMTLGCTGVISVIGNAYPREFGKMVSLCQQGNYTEALKIHFHFTEMFNLLFVDGNPAGVKCALNALGLIENELRLPLVPTRMETYDKIHDLMIRLKTFL